MELETMEVQYTGQKTRWESFVFFKSFSTLTILFVVGKRCKLCDDR